MKKMYNQPECSVEELKLMNVILGASFGQGDPAPGDSIGD